MKGNGGIIEKTLGREANLYSISFRSQVLNDEDWENEAFKEKLSNLIKPKQSFHFTKIPSGSVSIAIHIRSRNNGFDSSQEVEQMPTKFPPYSFYLNALKNKYPTTLKIVLFMYISLQMILTLKSLKIHLQKNGINGKRETKLFLIVENPKIVMTYMFWKIFSI